MPFSFFNDQYFGFFFLTTPDDKQVWAVLKPGFFALVADPMDTKLLDIIVFDVLPTLEEKEGSQACLAYQVKERNPLRYSFKVHFLSSFCSSYFQFRPALCNFLKQLVCYNTTIFCKVIVELVW